MTIQRERNDNLPETLNVATREGLRILRRESRTGEIIRVVTDDGRHLVLWYGAVKAVR